MLLVINKLQTVNLKIILERILRFIKSLLLVINKLQTIKFNEYIEYILDSSYNDCRIIFIFNEF